MEVLEEVQLEAEELVERAQVEVLVVKQLVEQVLEGEEVQLAVPDYVE